MELIHYEDTKSEFNYIKRLDTQLEEKAFFLKYLYFCGETANSESRGVYMI